MSTVAARPAALPARRPTRDLGVYVPRVLRTWDLCRQEPYAELPGTMMSIDIVGFTAMSERLARYGRQGAEEVTALVNSVFTDVIDAAEARGGDVLTFGGDGVTVWFDHEHHTLAAAAAAMQMQQQIGVPRTTATGEDVALEMCVGIHTGTVWFFTVQPGHRDLVITGPGAAATVRAESAATAGEILLTAEAAAAMPSECRVPALDGTYHLLTRLPAGADLTVLPPAPRAPLPPAEAFVPSGQAALVTAGAGHGEHRMVTSAFVRFADLDDRLAAEGAAHVHERLTAFMAVLGEALETTGVHWIQSDAYPGGAKLLLAAGAPTSREDDEMAMLRCLRQVVEAHVDLDLRIGVNRGPTFGGDVGSWTSRRAYAVMADDVNLAARLMGKAGPNEVIATAELLSRVTAPLQVVPLEPFMVKGKSMPIEAAIVTGIGRPEEPVAGDDTPFVGRDAELAQLLDAASAARDGAGGTIVLEGDAGLGKSRLLREAVSRAPGLVIHRLRADRYEATTAYALASRLLVAACGEDVRDPDGLQSLANRALGGRAGLAPLLGDVLGVTMAPTEESASIEASFVQATTAQLAADLAAVSFAAAGPTLVVVEDLHWLDEASVAVLQRFSRLLRQLPVLLLATTRPHTRTLPAAEIIALRPLEGHQAVALARAFGQQIPDRVIQAMVDRAGGNPLFVQELVAALAASASTDAAALPDTLEALITARLDTLPVGDRVVLRDAGVLGNRVRLDLLADAREEPIPGGWPARVADFLDRAGEGELSFKHDLYRDAAYGSLAFERRATLHRRVGTLLEREGADDAVLALHFDRGGDAERTWRYAVRAGVAAHRKHAVAEAATLLKAALGRADDVAAPPEERLEITELLGDVHEVLGAFADAEAAYAGALEDLADEPADITRLMSKVGRSRRNRGDFRGASESYGLALGQARRINDHVVASACKADVLLGTAAVAYREGRFGDCERDAREAAHDAVEGAMPRALARGILLMDLSINAAGRPSPYGGWAAKAFAAAGDLSGEGDALNNEGIAAFYAGRWDDALEAYTRSEEVRRRAGDVMGQAMSANNIGEVLSDQGRLDEAEERFSSAFRDWQACGYAIGIALARSNLGRVQLRRGEVVAGRLLLEEAMREFEAIDAAQYVLETAGRLAEADLAEGDAAAAARRLRTIHEGMDRGSLPAVEAWLTRLSGEAALALDEDEEGRRLLASVLDLAGEAEVPYEAMLAARALGDSETARRLATSLGVRLLDGPDVGVDRHGA